MAPVTLDCRSDFINGKRNDRKKPKRRKLGRLYSLPLRSVESKPVKIYKAFAPLTNFLYVVDLSIFLRIAGLHRRPAPS
jgi:hypothetical protein